eukprot:221272_1
MFQFVAFNEGKEEVVRVDKPKFVEQEQRVKQLYRTALESQHGGDSGAATGAYCEILRLMSAMQKALSGKDVPESCTWLMYLTLKNLGAIKEKNEEYLAALDCFLKAARLHKPACIDSTGGSGHALPVSHAAVRARRSHQSDLRGQPDPMLWLRVGELAFKLEKLPLARFAFESGVQLAPDSFLLTDSLLDVLYACADWHSIRTLCAALREDGREHMKARVLDAWICAQESRDDPDTRRIHMNKLADMKASEPKQFEKIYAHLQDLKSRFRKPKKIGLELEKIYAHLQDLKSRFRKPKKIGLELEKLCLRSVEKHWSPSGGFTWNGLVDLFMDVFRCSSVTASAGSTPLTARLIIIAFPAERKRALSPSAKWPEAKRRRDCELVESVATDSPISNPSKQSKAEKIREALLVFVRNAVDTSEIIIEVDGRTLELRRKSPSDQAGESISVDRALDRSMKEQENVQNFIEAHEQNNGIADLSGQLLHELVTVQCSRVCVDPRRIVQLCNMVTRIHGERPIGSPSCMLTLAELFFDEAIEVLTAGRGLLKLEYGVIDSESLSTRAQKGAQMCLEAADHYILMTEVEESLKSGEYADQSESCLSDSERVRLLWLKAHRESLLASETSIEHSLVMFYECEQRLLSLPNSILSRRHIRHSRVISRASLSVHRARLRVPAVIASAKLEFERGALLEVVEILAQPILADSVVGISDSQLHVLLRMLESACTRLGGHSSILLRCRVKLLQRFVGQRESSNEVACKKLLSLVRKIDDTIAEIAENDLAAALSPDLLFSLQRSLATILGIYAIHCRPKDLLFTGVCTLARVSAWMAAGIHDNEDRRVKLYESAHYLISLKRACNVRGGCFLKDMVSVLKKCKPTSCTDLFALGQCYTCLYGLGLTSYSVEYAKHVGAKLELSTKEVGSEVFEYASMFCDFHYNERGRRKAAKGSNTKEIEKVHEDFRVRLWELMDALYALVGDPPINITVPMDLLRRVIDGKLDLGSVPKTTELEKQYRNELESGKFGVSRLHMRYHMMYADLLVDEVQLDMFGIQIPKSYVSNIESMLLNDISCCPSRISSWYWLGWFYVQVSNIFTLDVGAFSKKLALSEKDKPEKSIADKKNALQELLMPAIRARQCLKFVLREKLSPENADMQKRVLELLGCMTLRIIEHAVALRNDVEIKSGGNVSSSGSILSTNLVSKDLQHDFQSILPLGDMITEARQYFELLSQRFPDDWLFVVYLGRLEELASSDPMRCLPIYSRAVHLAPDDTVDPLFTLHRARLAILKHSKSNDDLKQLLKFSFQSESQLSTKRTTSVPSKDRILEDIRLAMFHCAELDDSFLPALPRCAILARIVPTSSLQLRLHCIQWLRAANRPKRNLLADLIHSGVDSARRFRAYCESSASQQRRESALWVHAYLSLAVNIRDYNAFCTSTGFGKVKEDVEKLRVYAGYILQLMISE